MTSDTTRTKGTKGTKAKQSSEHSCNQPFRCNVYKKHCTCNGFVAGKRLCEHLAPHCLFKVDSYEVNIAFRTCTCPEFQKTHKKCKHLQEILREDRQGEHLQDLNEEQTEELTYDLREHLFVGLYEPVEYIARYYRSKMPKTDYRQHAIRRLLQFLEQERMKFRE